MAFETQQFDFLELSLYDYRRERTSDPVDDIQPLTNTCEVAFFSICFVSSVGSIY